MTHFLDTLAGHSSLTLLSGHPWRTPRGWLPKVSFSTRLSPKVRIQASKTSVFHETFTKSENPSFQNERFPRDFHCHQKWESKLPKRAFSTRLSPKVRIQASKTSVFHETFTKSDNPSFQNEHFPQDFHQNWKSKLPNRAFYTRLLAKANFGANNLHRKSQCNSAVQHF